MDMYVPGGNHNSLHHRTYTNFKSSNATASFWSLLTMYVLCRYSTDVEVAFDADGRGRLGAGIPCGLLSSVALRDGGACSVLLEDYTWGVTDGVDGRVVDLFLPQVPDGVRTETIVKTTISRAGRMPVERVELRLSHTPRTSREFECYSYREKCLFFDMRDATICGALVPTHDFSRYMTLNRVDYVDIVAPQLAGTTAHVRFGCVDVEHVGTGQRLVHALCAANSAPTADTYNLMERVTDSIARTGSYYPGSDANGYPAASASACPTASGDASACPASETPVETPIEPSAERPPVDACHARL